LFLILGMIAGFTTAMFSLVKLTRPPGPDNRAG
jgi:hypothetical protein